MKYSNNNRRQNCALTITVGMVVVVSYHCSLYLHHCSLHNTLLTNGGGGHRGHYCRVDGVGGGWELGGGIWRWGLGGGEEQRCQAPCLDVAG